MRQSYRSGIRKLYDSADPVTGREKEKQNHNRALKRGDIVIIPEFNKEGTVLTDEDKDGYVMVQAGIIKTKGVGSGSPSGGPQRPQGDGEQPEGILQA